MKNNSVKSEIFVLATSKEEELLQAYPWRLREFLEQSKDLCFAAIKADPNVLCFIRNQSEEMCLEAVRRDYRVLPFVREINDCIAREALAINPKAIYYFPQQWFKKYINEVSKELFPMQ